MWFLPTSSSQSSVDDSKNENFKNTSKCTIVNYGKRQKADPWFPRTREKHVKWEVIAKRSQVSFESDGNVLKLIAMMVAQFSAFY